MRERKTDEEKVLLPTKESDLRRERQSWRDCDHGEIQRSLGSRVFHQWRAQTRRKDEQKCRRRRRHSAIAAIVKDEPSHYRVGLGQHHPRRAAHVDRSRSLRPHPRDRDRGAGLSEIVAQRTELGRVDRLQPSNRLPNCQRDPRDQAT